MEDGVRGGGRGWWRREEASARDFGDRDTEVEDGGGEVLGGVDSAFDAENLLGAGDGEVVEGGAAVMSKAGTEGRERSSGEEHAAGATVEVQAEFGVEGEDGGVSRREDGGEIGVVVEDRCEARLDDDGEAKIRASAMEQMNGWSGEDAVAERAEADEGKGSPVGELTQGHRRRSVAGSEE
jgi:hypothetical protein